MSLRAFAFMLWFAMTIALSIAVAARPSAEPMPRSGANQPTEGAAARARDQDAVEIDPRDEPEAETPTIMDDGLSPSDITALQAPRNVGSETSYAAMIGFLLPLLAALGGLGWVVFRRIAALDRRIAALEFNGRKRDPTAFAETDPADPPAPVSAMAMPPLSPSARPERRVDPSPTGKPLPARETIEPVFAVPPPPPPLPPLRRPVVDPISRTAAPAPAPTAMPQDRQERPGSATIDALLEEVSRMAASPSLKGSDYDAALAQFGTLCGIRLDQERLRLIDPEQDVPRRLSAVVLAQDRCAVIVPSARWIKQFDMTYKESLEAGADVTKLFDLCPDGSGVLKVQRPALALIDNEGYLFDIDRGVLVGFVR